MIATLQPSKQDVSDLNYTGHHTPSCHPYESLQEDFIEPDQAEVLDKFTAERASDFGKISDSRDVLYFGEYKYKYAGVSHDESPIPDSIQTIINNILLEHPKSKINSCLVTRYTNGKHFCPPHSDDEPFIDPASKIFTLSIGAKRSMRFSNRSNSQETKSIDLTPCSLLTFDRHSQDFWHNSVVADDSIADCRYSFTFRHLSPVFLNSTAVIGDSNTKGLNFGVGPGSFGRWFPGKCIKASHVNQIPEPHNIGPYRNIVLHSGINDFNPKPSKYNPRPRPKPIYQLLPMSLN